MDGKKTVQVEFTLDELGNLKQRAFLTVSEAKAGVSNSIEGVDKDYPERVKFLQAWEVLLSKLEKYFDQAKDKE